MGSKYQDKLRERNRISNESAYLAEEIAKFNRMVFSDKKDYLSGDKEYIIDDMFSITFKEKGEYTLWKKTDFSKQPEYKGESLCKPIHRFYAEYNAGRCLEKVIEASSWVCI